MSKSPTTTDPGADDETAEAPPLALPPIHPGEILRDELEALELSATALADGLNLPSEHISDILQGTRAITADTALRLGRYFGTSARFWMNLQTSYDLQIAERERGGAIASSVHPHAA